MPFVAELATATSKILDVISGDGMPMDAYILDVHTAVDKITGRVIGVLQRINDEDDPKLLACIGEDIPSTDEIQAMLQVPEQWFEYKLHIQRERPPKEPFFSV